MPGVNAPSRRRNADRVGAAATIGAVGTALASSACCWLPLGLMSVGASAAGAGAFFAQWRPVFASAAIASLGLGFYFAYSRHSGGGCGRCAAKAKRSLRVRRGALWVSAVVVAAFVTFPQSVGAIIGAPVQATPASDANRTRFSVEGMTCSLCAVSLERTPREIEGVEHAAVDFAAGAASVRGKDPTITRRVQEAAKRLGFIATPAEPDESAPREGDTP